MVLKWISTLQCHPDKDGHYLVTRKKAKGNVTEICLYLNNAWGHEYVWYSSKDKKRYTDARILAWMPLPIPYMEKDEAEASPTCQ